MAREYVVPVTWQMRGFVKICAESIEEAIARAENADDMPIPTDSEYVNGSCQIENDDAESVEMYTNAYDSGDLGQIPEDYEDEKSE
jgi:hypothetical protein